ncbi:hypothetical protein AB0333_07020 [Citricoccus sp. NPDC079358]|uniref:hypothetical protein n=1 Tax=Citricoccus sp. NPDC079358 TaxID=3154653 RepID=UPI003450896E
MADIDYGAMFALLDRLDPDVLDLPEDKTRVEDAVAELKLAFGETACAGTAESAGTESLGPALLDVIVQCENVLAGTRAATTSWQDADQDIQDDAGREKARADAVAAEQGALD